MTSASDLARKLGVLALVVMVVMQPTVGAVTASESSPDRPCEYDLVDMIFSVNSPDFSQECPFSSNVRDGEDVYDAHVQALSASDTGEISKTLTGNELNATKYAAWAQVEASLIQSIEENKTRAEAMAAAKSTLNNSTAAMQNNLLNAYESQLAQVQYSYYVADQNNLVVSETDGGYTSDADVLFMREDDASVNPIAYDDQPAGPDITQWTNNSTAISYDIPPAELANGETRNYTFISFGSSPHAPFGNDTRTARGLQMYVKHPDSAFNQDLANTQLMMDVEAYEIAMDDIQEQHQFLLNNTELLVNNTYDGGPPDDVPSELVNALNMQVFATDTGGTGSYSLARVSLMTAGISNDVNSSFTIEYDPAEGQSFRGDVSVELGTAGGVALANPTFGDGAIVTQNDRLRFDFGNVSDPRLVVDPENGDTFELSARANNNSNARDWYVSVGNNRTYNFTGATNATVHVEAEHNGSTVSTESMNWTYDKTGETTRTLYGGLFTDWAPASTNGSFVNGTTYDTANADAPVWFVQAETDGTGTMLTLNGTFTVDQLTNAATGESLNQTTLEDDQKQEVDTVLNQTLIDRLIEERNQAETVYVSAGGGGGGDWFDGFDFGAAGFGFIAIIGGALLLLSKRS